MYRSRGLGFWVVLLTVVLTGCGGGGSDSGAGGGSGGLNLETREALTGALLNEEGEYAAYAAYSGVIDRYGNVEPYVTIRRAEARHIAALQRTLSRYGVTYPGNPYLGRIAAPGSLREAARAWAQGEIENVRLYDRLLPKVKSYPDIARVFGNLRAASLKRHLPAFEEAAKHDGTLTAAQMRRLFGG